MKGKKGALAIDSEMIVYFLIALIVLAVIVAAYMGLRGTDMGLLSYIKRLFTFGR